MGKHYSHLALDERLKLAKWRDAKVSMKEIAVRLGRPPCTLYRELRRNRFTDAELPQLYGYYGMNAQSIYAKRRSALRKLVKHTVLKDAVLDHLAAGWSPEQIAGRMYFERHPVRVSHETIYRYVYSEDGRQAGLWRHLPMHRRHRRPRGTRRPHALNLAWKTVSHSARPRLRTANSSATGNAI
ncbi:hypothetical protein OCH239_21425 [Roseivivax halodurans JCM 10272]|uniref:Transposase IS30-like HTH domain-containing protein n=1 Tax=Roseivivax halodurans JCM 10272 TaxID=1449350 RepID=X7E5Y3_9RHOB|nr:hypothetical protein OCH239_21425 [Roseivivax halodurans JCM 10272]